MIHIQRDRRTGMVALRPDLDPLGHLWFRLRRLVFQLRQDSGKLYDDAYRVRDALCEGLGRS